MKQVFILTFLIGFICTGKAQTYQQQINDFRQQQLASLNQKAKGPIAEHNLSFLNYYDADEAFKVDAKVEYLFQEPSFRMPTSDGTSKEFKRFALLHFSLKGQDFILPLYENVSLFQTNVQSSYLFLPILDLTTGESTYESGRYIDVKRQDIQNGILHIDFNKAYNPYCAYSSGYRCPQPPKENYLDIAITAGEKKYTGPKNQREQDTTMNKSFTEKEKSLINAGDPTEKMYVLQTTETKDSVILRTQSDDIQYDDPLIATLSKKMFATVRDPEHPGVGIAAPQVGINKNLIWVQRFDKVQQPFEFYINPKIIWRSKLLRKGAEGCLSIPNQKEDVIRSYAIKIQYIDQKSGKPLEEIVEGFTAVIFQHEVDHLYGILFPDRLEEQQTKETAILNENIQFSVEKGTFLP
ncbi:peptide deformylase [Sphingobacterium sp. LRF_L2]|uniref:peptide deformylase n=1 Tax=Sphingobacterium sp. LRF_L2 TaxID=3369421 RepID=UPI003F6139DE